jgi:DNA-binding Lrp family transcriptional regulator
VNRNAVRACSGESWARAIAVVSSITRCDWTRRATRLPVSTGASESLECRRMFGLPDYLIRVGVSDPAAYEAFYMNKLAELPGLARVNSQFTMKTVKRDGASRSSSSRR